MANNLRTRLLSPYAKVTVSISVDGPDAVRFWYSGPPDQLIASGAIEAHMAETTDLRGKGAVRTDSHGDYFARDKQPNGKLRIFRSVKDGARALSLPGMRHHFPKGLPDELVRYVTACSVAAERQDDRVVSGRGAKFRKRTVGRHRRFMEWATNEDVIFIDWGQVRGTRVRLGGAA